MKKVLPVIPVLIIALAIGGFVYFDVVGLDAFILVNFLIGIFVLLVKLSQATVKSRKAEMERRLRKKAQKEKKEKPQQKS